MIDDAVTETKALLRDLAPNSAADIRHAPEAVAAFSRAMTGDLDVLRNFLTTRVYRHERMMRIMGRAEQVVSDLFGLYTARAEALPPEWQAQAPPPGSRAHARYICDFIAGMTDRYALAEHRRLFDETPDLR